MGAELVELEDEVRNLGGVAVEPGLGELVAEVLDVVEVDGLEEVLDVGEDLEACGVGGGGA